MNYEAFYGRDFKLKLRSQKKTENDATNWNIFLYFYVPQARFVLHPQLLRFFAPPGSRGKDIEGSGNVSPEGD